MPIHHYLVGFNLQLQKGLNGRILESTEDILVSLQMIKIIAKRKNVSEVNKHLEA